MVLTTIRQMFNKLDDLKLNKECQQIFTNISFRRKATTSIIIQT